VLLRQQRQQLGRQWLRLRLQLRLRVRQQLRLQFRFLLLSSFFESGLKSFRALCRSGADPG